jgi:hypothetical protein
LRVATGSCHGFGNSASFEPRFRPYDALFLATAPVSIGQAIKYGVKSVGVNGITRSAVLAQNDRQSRIIEGIHHTAVVGSDPGAGQVLHCLVC